MIEHGNLALERIRGKPSSVTRDDLEIIATLYARAFAGRPWCEYTVCSVEGLFFGRDTNPGDRCSTPGCIGTLVLAYPLEQTIEYIRQELERPLSALFLLRDQDDGKIVGFSWGFSYPTVASFVADKYKTPEMRAAIGGLLQRLSIGQSGLWYLSESGIEDDPRYRGQGWSGKFHRERLIVANAHGLDAIQRTSCDGPMYFTSRRLMTQIMGPESATAEGIKSIYRTGEIVNGIVDLEMPSRALFVKFKENGRLSSMNRAEVYTSLQEKMLDYSDYVDVPLEPTTEELVAIPKNGGVVGQQIDKAMYQYTGDTVYVRWSVLQKLREAAKLLQEYSKTCQLEVVYGYRALEAQNKLFEEQEERLRQQEQRENLEDFVAATHRVIAVPKAAGHPTGGAVDVQIIEQGEPRDMGTPIWEFVPDALTFSPFVTKEAWSNRQLLRRIMLTVGFAPFDGEWWHFSYGDKEWAKYYGERAAIYDQIAFSDSQGNL